MNIKPKYYEEKIKLFIALCPPVFFEHMKESKILNFADEDTAQYLIMGKNFLEFGGKNKDKPDPFIIYINENFSSICLADPSVCDVDRYYTSKESIDSSESIDINRMDPEKIDLYVN